MRKLVTANQLISGSSQNLVVANKNWYTLTSEFYNLQFPHSCEQIKLYNYVKFYKNIYEQKERHTSM